MIKIDDEYELSLYRDLEVVTLIHIPCKDKRYKGYVSRSKFYKKDCFDCGVIVSDDTVNKSRFILGEQ